MLMRGAQCWKSQPTRTATEVCNVGSRPLSPGISSSSKQFLSLLASDIFLIVITTVYAASICGHSGPLANPVLFAALIQACPVGSLPYFDSAMQQSGQADKEPRHLLRHPLP
jgi:predicted lipase